MDASFLDLLMAQQEEVTEAEGGGGIWVVADVVNGTIAPVTLEAIGAARNLAGALGAYVYARPAGRRRLRPGRHPLPGRRRRRPRGRPSRPGLVRCGAVPGGAGQPLPGRGAGGHPLWGNPAGAGTGARVAQRLGGGLMRACDRDDAGRGDPHGPGGCPHLRGRVL